jgi:hypothetical protein
MKKSNRGTKSLELKDVPVKEMLGGQIRKAARRLSLDMI